MPPSTPNPAPLSLILSDFAQQIGLSRPAALCLGAIWRGAQNPSADDLVATLGISRSNVSTALKELREVGLVQAARTPGSRKDYFIAHPDPWVLIHALLLERQRRSLTPLLARLRMDESHDPRLPQLREVVEQADAFMTALAQLSPQSLAELVATTPVKLAKKKKKHRKS